MAQLPLIYWRQWGHTPLDRKRVMRSSPHTLRLLALGLCMTGLPAVAQMQVLSGQGSSEVHKCVRAGEIFYTNGSCPGGTTEVRLGESGQGGRVRTVPATPTSPVPVAPVAPVAPAPPRVASPQLAPVQPAHAPAATSAPPTTRLSPSQSSHTGGAQPSMPPPPVAQPGLITITPSPSAQRRAAPVMDSQRRSPPVVDAQPIEPWTRVEPGALQRRPAVAAPRTEVDAGPRPLSAVPPLPESDAGRRAERLERQERADRSGAVVQLEEPMRGAGRPGVDATPAPDVRANNQAMCGFVNAELARLSEEAGATSSEDVRSRIATQQQRLKARHVQLKC